MKYGFGLTSTAQHVLKSRYLIHNEKGDATESIPQCVDRITKAISLAEPSSQRQKREDQFRDLIFQGLFCPNSPTIMNAGKDNGQLAACFVLPIEDDIRGIFETLKDAAWIQQSGGGTGFSFGRLRPSGDLVLSTFGPASGPIGFLKVFDQATESVKQGGARRGANMGILPCTHPDIEAFIHCKEMEGAIRNFNISVGVDSDFMKAVESKSAWGLLNPRNHNVVRQVQADKLFSMICQAAWRNGEPGLVFLDRINEDNPTPELGVIESTNPCGEQPLLPFEACNLGSINLAALFRPTQKDLDWELFKSVIELGVRFLDDVIEVNSYPLAQIEATVKLNRKIGLGLMGLADVFVLKKISYDSAEALDLSKRIAKFFAEHALQASTKLGEERGHCPQWLKSKQKKYALRRNATVTTVAPTGTISLIMGCSAGIEPIFSFLTQRNILDGSPVIDMHELFHEHLVAHKIKVSDVLSWLNENPQSTSLHECPLIPERHIWKTATGVHWKTHIEMQGLFQDAMDNGVSKTINLAEDSTLETVKEVFTYAWKRRLKGITIYRHRSRKLQSQALPQAKHETCGSELIAMEGCLYCPTCHVSLCGSE